MVHQPHTALSMGGSFSNNQQASALALPETIQVVGNQPMPELQYFFLNKYQGSVGLMQAEAGFSVI